jgi:hypothetical protein
MSERRLSAVPRGLLWALAAAFLLQLTFAALQPRPRAVAEDLPVLHSAAVLRAVSLGDPIPLAQALTLYLQAYDNQPGISIPFLQLDYDRVEQWLTRILELDPVGQYPLMMAAQVYAQVPDARKQRRMLEFVYARFSADPDRRWRWLAHAVIITRHRLEDPALALRYARALRVGARGPSVPGWARQMEIFLYEDMGEYQSAKVLLGGLLASGEVSDPHEVRFLLERLKALEAAEKSSAASKK